MNKNKEITKRGYWICNKKDDYKFDWQLCSMLGTLLRGQTVLDLGCGNGAYTNYLHEKGINIHGCDGNPHTREIGGVLCHTCDLSMPMNEEPVDWVLCLEVAEHIPVEYQDVFIDNLKKHAKKGVIISWAIPKQGGHGHVNEQTNDYVRGLFDGWIEDLDKEEQLRAVATLPWFKNTVLVFEKGI